MTKPNKKLTVSFALGRPLIQFLDSLAAKYHCSRSEALASILIHYEHEGKEPSVDRPARKRA